jgi:hypothetical protein
VTDVVGHATADGKQYAEGYELIEPRDLEARYLYRPSIAKVRGVNVQVVPGLKVGVMGIGDQVPIGLQQLAPRSQCSARDLATADLSVYDAIMTGTRAYAVREDLKTYNTRLLDYVKAGGNMIVLYNVRAGAEPVRSVSWRAAGGRRGGVGRGLADHDPGSHRAVVHLAEQDHAGRLRRLGRTARIKVLHDVDRRTRR